MRLLCDDRVSAGVEHPAAAHGLPGSGQGTFVSPSEGVARSPPDGTCASVAGRHLQDVCSRRWKASGEETACDVKTRALHTAFLCASSVFRQAAVRLTLSFPWASVPRVRKPRPRYPKVRWIYQLVSRSPGFPCDALCNRDFAQMCVYFCNSHCFLLAFTRSWCFNLNQIIHFPVAGCGRGRDEHIAAPNGVPHLHLRGKDRGLGMCSRREAVLNRLSGDLRRFLLRMCRDLYNSSCSGLNVLQCRELNSIFSTCTSCLTAFCLGAAPQPTRRS